MLANSILSIIQVLYFIIGNITNSCIIISIVKIKFDTGSSYCPALCHLLQLGHHLPVLQLLQVGGQDPLQLGQVLALQLRLNHRLLRSWLYLMLYSFCLQNIWSVEIIPRVWLWVWRSVVYLRCLLEKTDVKIVPQFFHLLF